MKGGNFTQEIGLDRLNNYVNIC